MAHATCYLFSKLSRALYIEWAPLNVPLSRRLQTLAVAGVMFIAILGHTVGTVLFFKLIYSRLWWLAIAYAIWMIYDIDVCNRGSRTSEWVRNWSWWRYFRDYFPIRLVKTADLNPACNYLFACFPHGILPSGAFGVFATNTLYFSKKFPGMTPHLIVLRLFYIFPFFRDLSLALGGCASSQESLMYLLDLKRFKGKCAALVVGGAAEALEAQPGVYKICLSRRKGFIRVAIKSGAPLVPVFSFGEPDTFRPFTNPEGSWIRRIQEAVKNYTGVSPVFPIGRGFLQYSFGILPLRTPINVVVGAPMEVERNLEPTEEQVDAVHAEFTRRLVELFETEKSKYLKNHETNHLIIV